MREQTSLLKELYSPIYQYYNMLRVLLWLTKAIKKIRKINRKPASFAAAVVRSTLDAVIRISWARR